MHPETHRTFDPNRYRKATELPDASPATSTTNMHKSEFNASPTLETSMTWQETFNRSRFSHFINSPPGRIFRVVAGAAFLIVGFVFRHHPLGVLSMLWSVLPLTAGFFDVCYISLALGGPFSGAIIRDRYRQS